MKKLRKMKNQKGFTLVEVIVVLVILAIMAAILIPSLVGYIDKARENSIVTETRSIVQAVQTESSTAYGRDKGVTIAFGTGDSSYDSTTKEYTIGLNEIKKLTENDNLSAIKSGNAPGADEEIIVKYKSDGATIEGLWYTSGDKTCSYPGYEVKDVTP